MGGATAGLKPSFVVGDFGAELSKFKAVPQSAFVAGLKCCEVLAIGTCRFQAELRLGMGFLDVKPGFADLCCELQSCRFVVRGTGLDLSAAGLMFVGKASPEIQFPAEVDAELVVV